METKIMRDIKNMFLCSNIGDREETSMIRSNEGMDLYESTNKVKEIQKCNYHVAVEVSLSYEDEVTIASKSSISDEASVSTSSISDEASVSSWPFIRKDATTWLSSATLRSIAKSSFDDSFEQSQYRKSFKQNSKPMTRIETLYEQGKSQKRSELKRYQEQKSLRKYKGKQSTKSEPKVLTEETIVYNNKMRDLLRKNREIALQRKKAIAQARANREEAR